jgi:hypothetical protein
MSVHDPAKFQQYSVIFAKSAADTKNRMFFRDRALFMADTVQVQFEGTNGREGKGKKWGKGEVWPGSDWGKSDWEDEE